MNIETGRCIIQITRSSNCENVRCNYSCTPHLCNIISAVTLMQTTVQLQNQKKPTCSFKFHMWHIFKCFSSVYVNFTYRVPYFQVLEHSDGERSQNTGPIGPGHKPSIFAVNRWPTGIVLSLHLTQHLYLLPLLSIMYMKRMTCLHLGTRISREVYILILQTII